MRLWLWPQRPRVDRMPICRWRRAARGWRWVYKNTSCRGYTDCVYTAIFSQSPSLMQLKHEMVYLFVSRVNVNNRGIHINNNTGPLTLTIKGKRTHSHTVSQWLLHSLWRVSLRIYSVCVCVYIYLYCSYVKCVFSLYRVLISVLVWCCTWSCCDSFYILLSRYSI